MEVKVDKQKLKGLGLVMFSSLCYGMMPSVTQLAFKTGLKAETLLLDRYIISALIIWVYIFIKKIDYQTDKRHLLFLMLLGSMNIGFASCVNEAYKYVAGSIASVLVFLYVSIVILIEILIGREKVNLTRLICMALSFLGLVVVVWAPAGETNILGVFFAVITAVFYALYATGLGETKTKEMNAIVVIGYVSIPLIVFNLGRCAVSGADFFPQTVIQGLYTLGLAFFCSFLATVCFCQAVKYIGSSNAAIINTMEPVVAYFGGLFLMGDIVAPRAIIGGLMIISAIVVLNLPNKKEKMVED